MDPVALYALCAIIAWTPAWDITLEQDVELHFFYEDDLPGITAWNNEMEVCRVEYDRIHTYSVAGFVNDPNDPGQVLIGPESDDLTVVWPSDPIPEPSGLLMLLAGAWLLYVLHECRKFGRKGEKR
jgi:hypothetical protein